jgi:hypothetical protein
VVCKLVCQVCPWGRLPFRLAAANRPSRPLWCPSCLRLCASVLASTRCDRFACACGTQLVRKMVCCQGVGRQPGWRPTELNECECAACFRCFVCLVCLAQLTPLYVVASHSLTPSASAYCMPCNTVACFRGAVGCAHLSSLVFAGHSVTTGDQHTSLSSTLCACACGGSWGCRVAATAGMCGSRPVSIQLY